MFQGYPLRKEIFKIKKKSEDRSPPRDISHGYIPVQLPLHEPYF
jgi:hypothetical protein